MKKNNKLVSVLLALFLLLPGIAPIATGVTSVSAANEDKNTERLAGNTRVETSQVVSEEVHDDTDTVIIAGYNGEVDALTGTILAGMHKAPVLIISEKPGDIKQVKDEIKRLGATKAILLGDEQVISADIASQLGEVTVTRQAGNDRFDTAVEIANAAGDSYNHVFLTNDGRSGELADALASGPVSARDQDPILLTSQSKVPEQTLKALEDLSVKEITIIGGEVAVDGKIESQLKDAGYTVNRLAGDNRWKTAVLIADKYFSSSENSIVANDGRSGSYADALVGGYLGNKKAAPIVLTQSHVINETTKSYLENSASFAYILGGFNAVSEGVESSVETLLTEVSEEVEVSGQLKVHYINVGQGDSTLIELPNNKTVLIDGGTRGHGQTVADYLDSLDISHLDYLIATHPHADHIGGLVQIVENYSIGKIFMPKVSHTTIVYEDFLQAIKNKDYSISRPKVGRMLFEEKGLSMNVLAPDSNISATNLNDNSIANRLVFGETIFLFTGDAERKSEQNMVNSGLDLSADVLKVGHHGGDTSSIDAFLSKVGASYGVISSGANNQYNHPHPNVLGRLANHQMKVFRTDQDGTIIASSDGKNIKFNKKETSKPPNDESEEQVEVYGTETGSKYHKSTCHYLKKSKIKMTLEEAKEEGLEPCGVCKPQ